MKKTDEYGAEDGQCMAKNAGMAAAAKAPDGALAAESRHAALLGGGKAMRVHMLGVNGISMSGLAELLLGLGHKLSGSDLTESTRTDRLKSLGADIRLGHSAGNVAPGTDLLVYTAAVKPDNPEYARAAELRIPLMERAELLGHIMATHKNSIAVAGTHGKTTTTSMLAEIFMRGGYDPSVHIGAEYGPIGGTTRAGKGGQGIFVAEACEYKDSFLKLRPSVAAILNVDFDHADYFCGIEHVKRSFRAFCAQTGDFVVANADDANIAAIYRELPERERKKWLLFGFCQDGGKCESNVGGKCEGDGCERAAGSAECACGSEHASGGIGIRKRESDGGECAVGSAECACGDERTSGGEHASGGGKCESGGGARLPLAFAGENLSFGERHSAAFDLRISAGAGRYGGSAGSTRIRLKVPGIHNARNAMAAAATAIAFGCPPDAAVAGLEAFGGAKKRFELKGEAHGLTLIDDYAHHPSEIAPALLAAKNYAGGADVWCVFQPHTYTRTKTFMGDFARVFGDAHAVILPDIFAAREEDPGDVSSEMLAAEINKVSRNAVYIGGGFGRIADYIRQNAKKGDLVVTMGAGLASTVADILLGP
jgi:UDP-N-acetylmuramate--alanine ligase